MPRKRHMKETVRLALAASGPTDQALDVLDASPPAALTGPLLSSLLSPEPLARWRAVTALGRAVARMAEARLEDARVFVRRLMWHLNEESGAIGWGAPEAMAEILSRNADLAREYHRILLSYIREFDKDCTFIDHPPLRRGAYWGVARLAQARPELVLDAVSDIIAGLSDCDPESRGLCCLALTLLRPPETPEMLAGILALSGDAHEFELYWDGELKPARVSDLARAAYALVSQPGLYPHRP
ncbi:MAG: DVU0298 family protein [Thermodesulfobacteriota bacterium]